MSSALDPAEEREAIQQSLRTGEFDSTAFGSPENGRVVELLMCEHLDLDVVDGPVADARDSDGTPIQIKACQREHANGGGETVPGRWDVWSEPLLRLMADGGRYLLVVYDGDQDPAEVTHADLEDYILAWRVVTADAVGFLVDTNAWHEANRPSKGRKARIFWTDVFGEVDA